MIRRESRRNGIPLYGTFGLNLSPVYRNFSVIFIFHPIKFKFAFQYEPINLQQLFVVVYHVNIAVSWLVYTGKEIYGKVQLGYSWLIWKQNNKFWLIFFRDWVSKQRLPLYKHHVVWAPRLCQLLRAGWPNVTMCVIVIVIKWRSLLQQFMSIIAGFWGESNVAVWKST